MVKNLLSVKDIEVKIGGQTILKNITLNINEGEQYAIVGPSGSGKTTLANTIAGKHYYKGLITSGFASGQSFHQSVQVVDQQHRFKDVANRSDFYYQQRYNSFDADRTITVKEELDFENNEGKSFLGMSYPDLLTMFQIDHLLHEPLIQLSNGENKRLQILKTLYHRPGLLILDQPFTGLDKEGVQQVDEILQHLASKGLLILLFTSFATLPGFINKVALLENGQLTSVVNKLEFDVQKLKSPLVKEKFQQLTAHASTTVANDFISAVKMKNVTIRYGDRTILDNINWEIKRGECWSLSGPNGAGKSTLLSLMTGDNPQAYANEIYLFDRRRGSGESIWDIKKKIGFISPEMHLYFDQSATCFETIASGFFDTIGLFRQLSVSQTKIVEDIIDLMRLKNSTVKRLFQLSLGEQRMCLLGRAIIKNPPLLILDEPCQGLDENDVSFIRELIVVSCRNYNTTVIYVTHRDEELPSVINRFLRLENGQVVDPINRIIT